MRGPTKAGITRTMRIDENTTNGRHDSSERLPVVVKVFGALRTRLGAPSREIEIPVGGYLFIAAKNTGCYPEPDLLLPELRFSFGDPLRITLKDKDERLMETAGSRTALPFAGGYDQFVSRSMEKAELMFGGRGYQPRSWHYYTDAEVDVPNNDLIAENCRERTLASPGRPNSPDYSGNFSSGEAF